MVDTPSHEEIIDAVRDAGWLLEHDSARALDRLGFHTYIGWPFNDPDDGTKSRELDVFAHRLFFRDPTTQVTVITRVLVECKQSIRPYVLIGRDLREHLVDAHPTEHILPWQTVLAVDDDAGSSPRLARPVDAWRQLGLHRLPGSPSESAFRGTQMTRLDRGKAWTASNDTVFTSLVFPLAKALLAAQSDFHTGDAQFANQVSARPATIALHFPVVVTSAPLFVIDATSDDLVLEPRPWTTMRRDLQTSSVDGVFDVDVVNAAHFERYLAERVLRFTESVVGLAAEDPAAFTRPLHRVRA